MCVCVGGGIRGRENCARKFFICLIKMCKESPKVKLYSLSLRKKQKAGKTAITLVYLQSSLLKRENEKPRVENNLISMFLVCTESNIKADD